MTVIVFIAQQIITITKPFKLRTLYILDDIYEIESIESLLQITGIYLENFALYFKGVKSIQLLKLITKYCANINL